MILEIKLKNFFSINEEIHLDLRAGNLKQDKQVLLPNNIIEYKKNYNVLKSAAIYGANASGKSNIIKAIEYCRHFIKFSKFNNELKFKRAFAFKTFKFKEDKESSFYIRFLDNEIEYEYSFVIKEEKIIAESLYHYPKGARALVFKRDLQQYHFSSKIEKPQDVSISTSDKTLYLTMSVFMNRKIPKIVYEYFNKKLILGVKTPDKYNVQELIKKIENNGNGEVKKQILNYLEAADIDIVDFKLEKTKKETGIGLDIVTYHRNNKGIAFDFNTEESEGTKKMFFVALMLIDVIENNQTIIIDELDNSFHYLITKYIISLFHKYDTKAQIIFSTHDIKLLDLDVFRKDQIYFVKKNQQSATELYSLFDFKDFRNNMDLEKAYLRGRFEAIPRIL